MSKTPPTLFLAISILFLALVLLMRNSHTVARAPGGVLAFAPAGGNNSDANPPSKIPGAGTVAAGPDPCENLYQLVCGNHRIIEDPTGVVEPDVNGEVEALRLYEQLIHNHNGSSDDVDDRLVHELYTPRRRKRLQEVFEWVRSHMLTLIASQPSSTLPPEAKGELMHLISTTELELPPPATLYKDELDVYTKNDVFFETLSDGRRVIRVGGAYLLAAKSWFNRVFTFAHELTHAIDPCDADPHASYLPAYRKIEHCFAREGIIRANGERCSSGQHLSEAFADWVGGQITAEAIALYEPKFHGNDALNSIINSVRDLCEDDWSENDAYPPPNVRVRIISGSNPVIRRLMSCPVLEKKKEPAYCRFDGQEG